MTKKFCNVKIYIDICIVDLQRKSRRAISEVDGHIIKALLYALFLTPWNLVVSIFSALLVSDYRARPKPEWDE